MPARAPVSHVVSQSQFPGVWVQVDLILKISHLENPNVVGHQRQRHDEGHNAVAVLFDVREQLEIAHEEIQEAMDLYWQTA